MNEILKINSMLNDFVWGVPMIVLLLGVGAFLCFSTGFWIYRNFGYILKNTFGQIFKKADSNDSTITPFQAVSTALAGTIGTGNIVGVATAISFGGPGAIFWMWLAAVIGMTTKFTEVTLSLATREKGKDGKFTGGPMYYLKKGTRFKFLAYLFSFFGFIAPLGTGAMVQANAIATSVNDTFGLDVKIAGIILSILMALVIIGGIKRIGAFAEKVVPIMSLFYVIGALIILFIQRKEILNAFVIIFESAFNPKAAGGSFAGFSVMTAIRWGLARGIFTNEAGIGTAPIAHSASHTDHPARQGIWGSFEVFMDTIVVCTMTALVIITSGLWKDSNLEGILLTSNAFSNALPVGKYIVNIGLMLFAFSTAVSWDYYGEKCILFIYNSDIVRIIYRIIYIVLCFVGAIGGLKFVWDIADTFNGLMAIPNLIGILLLSKSAKRLIKDFERIKYSKQKRDYSLEYDNKWKEFF
ncbi:MAG: sodium:alanine symporter family protein [Tissierellia bacterium]|nr:sodium:alanine symporter family protein [Tissierellia bacterium]